jgi:hypothetical protein
MTLAVVLDHVTQRLSERLDSGTAVGDATPDSTGLPAVTLGIDAVTSRLGGVGRTPRGTHQGALPVTLEIDLASPVLDLGGGETLLVVPVDRRSLVLPHGPLVRSDGTADDPFTSADLTVHDSSDWAIVATTPVGKQVRPDVDAGVLRLGQPLPATGTLRVDYVIGLWDSVVSRFQGRLAVLVTADRVDLGALTRQVADALAVPDPDMRLAPVSWGPTARLSDDMPDEARSQELGYLFDAEVEQPLLASGGGVIADVAVTLRAAENAQTRTETFDIVGTRKEG